MRPIELLRIPGRKNTEEAASEGIFPSMARTGGTLALAAMIFAAGTRAQEPQKPAAPPQQQAPQQQQSKPQKPEPQAAGPPQPPAILVATPQQEQAQMAPRGGCMQPAPMVTFQNYTGPFSRTAVLFERKLERRSVKEVQYKAGARLCTFAVKQKFLLFIDDSDDPITILTAAFNAGIDQAENNDPQIGQGAAGYGKRFLADYTDEASGSFFKFFLYPTIFREDPRYYRLGRGGFGRRLYHAVEHIAVAHSENGVRMPNISDWFGSVSAASLSNLYHPGNRRGFNATAENVGWSFANEVGFDVLREFWPEIAKKFKLPFRGQNQVN